ncbi:MAG: hypothetical protein KAV82_14105 [Phycisphaerae bacterium]|nr:hypothetical protein [Phycisphaerae bacterium]
MPGLASYEKNARSSGIVVIGVTIHSKKDKALKIVNKASAEFAIVNGGKVPGTKVGGYPTYTLYGRDGEIVSQQLGSKGKSKGKGKNKINDGLSDEFEVAIEKALASAVTVFLVDLEKYHEKTTTRYAKRARKGRGFGRLIEQLEETIAQGTSAEKTEAQRLKTAILDYGHKAFTAAEELEDESPHRHFDMMKDLAKSFRGHEIGDQAKAVYKSLKKDKETKKEIAAARLYEELQICNEREKKTIYRQIEKKYAETRFGRRALKERDADEKS